MGPKKVAFVPWPSAVPEVMLPARVLTTLTVVPLSRMVVVVNDDVCKVEIEPVAALNEPFTSRVY